MAASGPKASRRTGEILAMIPAPPARIAEARARLGKIGDDHGTRRDDGDVKSDPAQQALFDNARRRAAEAMAGAPAPQSRGLNGEQGKAIRALNDQGMNAGTRSRQWQGEATRASNDAKAALQKALEAIESDLHPKIERVCVDKGESAQAPAAQAARVAQCNTLVSQRNSRREAARQGYLDQLGPVASRLRERLKGLIADDQRTAAQVQQAFGSMQDAPSGATFGQMMEGNEAVLLQQLIGLNNSAVVDAAVKDPQF
jgi:hypothetical protein